MLSLKAKDSSDITVWVCNWRWSTNGKQTSGFYSMLKFRKPFKLGGGLSFSEPSHSHSNLNTLFPFCFACFLYLHYWRAIRVNSAYIKFKTQARRTMNPLVFTFALTFLFFSRANVHINSMHIVLNHERVASFQAVILRNFSYRMVRIHFTLRHSVVLLLVVF